MARDAEKLAALGLVEDLYPEKRRQGKLAVAPSKAAQAPAFGANNLDPTT